MSTHTLEIAEDICDRIGIIHRGALIATGTSGDLKRAASAIGVSFKTDPKLEEVFLKLTEEQIVL